MSNQLLIQFNRKQFKLSLMLLVGGVLYLATSFILQLHEKQQILNQQATYIARAVRNDLISGNQIYVYEQCRSLITDTSIQKIYIERSKVIYCDENKSKNNVFVITTNVPIAYNPSTPPVGNNLAGIVSLGIRSNALFLGSFLSLIFFIMLIFFYYRIIKKSQEEIKYSLIEPLNILTDIMRTDPQNIEAIRNINKSVIEEEIKLLFASYITLTEEIIEAEKIIRNQSRIEAISDISKQVAHDVRSPLAALNMVISSLNNIPEEQRVLIRNSAQRINDIANNLLQKNKSLESTDENNRSALSVELVSPIVDSIVSEKRTQYREYSSVDISINLDMGYGLFSKINPSELKSVISNLINNAVESKKNNNKSIIIKVTVDTIDSENLRIVILDNGSGIPHHILQKLGEKGVTEGKSKSHLGLSSGSGLGIYHGKQTIESFGGKLIIESDTTGSSSNGSKVSILLPLSEIPTWFIQELKIDPDMAIVSLDDDISIHQVWSERLKSLKLVGAIKIEHIIFSSGDEFLKSVPEIIDRTCLFLIDYELLGQQRNGLDVLEVLSQNHPEMLKKTFLVTSLYEEEDIRERCSRLGVKLLPKAMAGFVLFKLQKQNSRFDAVLLDDDELVRMTWAAQAKIKNIKLKIYINAHELLSDLDQFDKTTKFYIDSNLGKNADGSEVKGEIIAETLFKSGFAELFLCTGYDQERFSNLIFIKKVFSKSAPF